MSNLPLYFFFFLKKFLIENGRDSKKISLIFEILQWIVLHFFPKIKGDVGKNKLNDGELVL